MIISMLDSVDKISQEFVFNGYQQLVSEYALALSGMITLSIIIYGYLLLQGSEQFTFESTSKRMLTIAIVISLATQWGNFSSYVYDLFTKVPNDISVSLLKAIPGNQFDTLSGINEALNLAWNKGMAVVSAVWKQGGLQNWSPYIYGICLFAALVYLVSLALIELIVAKFGMSIFLVLAPVVIPFYLFQNTKSLIVEGWIRQLLTYSLIPIFVVTSLSLGLSLMSQFSFDLAETIKGDGLNMGPISAYLVSIIVCIGLLQKSAQKASSLGGGFSMTGMGAVKYGQQKAGQAAGKLMNYVKNMKSKDTPKKAGS